MDLDAACAELRTREKAEILFQTKSYDQLWFEHGLIGDLRVRLPHSQLDPAK